MRTITFVAWLMIACVANATPPELLKYENSVCRVTVSDKDGAKSHGSGVLIETPVSHDKAGNVYILTAHHVVADRSSSPGAVTVTWDGNNYIPASVAAARPGCDSVVLKAGNTSVTRDIPRVPLAQSEITLGERAFAFGFGDTTNNTLRCLEGTVVALTFNTYMDPVWYDILGQNRQGDSGGPVIVIRNGRPQLVGLAWGSGYDSSRSGYTTSCTRLAVINRLFGMEVAPVNRAPSNRSNGVRVVTEGYFPASTGSS